MYTARWVYTVLEPNREKNHSVEALLGLRILCVASGLPPPLRHETTVFKHILLGHYRSLISGSYCSRTRWTVASRSRHTLIEERWWCLDLSVANANHTNRSIDLQQTLMLPTSYYHPLDWRTLFQLVIKGGKYTRGVQVTRALSLVKSLTPPYFIPAIAAQHTSLRKSWVER